MVKEMRKRMKCCNWFPAVTAGHVSFVCSDMFVSIYVIYESQLVAGNYGNYDDGEFIKY